VIAPLTRTLLGALLTLSVCLIATACESSGGGGTCFPPEHGPSAPSCAGFDLNLSCPVDIATWYTCVCTAGGAGTGGSAGTGSGSAAQTWVCGPTGTSLGGAGGAGGSGGSGGAGGNSGAGGSGDSDGGA
jgi:hypothetical protein